MTLQLNPTVNDPFATKTLQQLRVMVQDALGFVQPQLPETNAAGFRTLGDLATQVRIALGIAAPVPVVPDTLGNIRTNLYNMLGMGAMTIHPPGVDTQLTTFINTAQQIIYRALEVDAGGIAQDLGPENVTNGSFNGSASSWTLGAEWAYSTASITNTNAGTHTVAQQLIPVVAGNTYFIQWTQSQSVPYNVGTNANGQGIIATLGGVQAAPILLQTTSAASVAVAITASVTGGVLLTFQNATGSPQLPGWTPSGTVAITGVSCKQMGVGTVLGTQPPPMLITGTNDAALTKLDATAILNLACALAKTHYGQPDGKTYFEWYQKWLKDLEGRGPPNISSIINNALQDAQREVSRTYEVAYAAGSIPSNAAFSAATDTVGMDAWAVYKLAVAKVKAMLKSNDAELALKEYTKYISDLNERMPANANSVINRLLKQAQDFLFRTYDVFRMERWFTWTLVAGQRFYGTLNDDNASVTSPTNVVAALGSSNASASLSIARAFYMSELLNNGKVLIFGGIDSNGNTLNTAELYDPATGTTSITGSMTYARELAQTVKLQNGNILVIGGFGGTGTISLSSCELYDVNAGTFSITGSLSQPRGFPTATLLQNGNVLVAGGQATALLALSSTEIYSPLTGAFALGPSMVGARNTAAATLLPTGTVLISGGNTSGSTGINGAEIYDPSTNTFTATGNLVGARQGHRSVLLNNGTVLIVGGLNISQLATAEIYTPNSGTFASTGSMSTPRYFPAVSKRNDGTVIVGAGQGVPTSVEIYTPSAGTFAATGSLPLGLQNFNFITLANNQTIAFGGYNGSLVAQTGIQVFGGSTFVTNGSLTQGNVYYRVANFNPQGFTIPSLPDAALLGVPANTAVSLSWQNSNNPSVTGSAIYGRSVAASTVTIASFIVSLPGSTGNVVTLISAAGITIGTTPSISDGVTTLSIKVTGVVSNTITYTLVSIVSGAAGNIMATAASVLLSSEKLLATVGPGVTTWTDLGTIVPSAAMPTVNTTASAFGMDPREVTFVGASCNQNTWRELKEGIPPQIYNAQVTGPPAYYEIRQAIELWPTPPDSTWQLQIKGYFSPLPFDTDSDTCWIDYQAVYLYATAKAMLQWPKRFDARAKADADAAWMRYVKELVAGTHKTARYVPGTPRYRPVRPLPVMVP